MYDNYEAENFEKRHAEWVNEAVEFLGEKFEVAKMKAECVDKFLVAAFLYATEHYVYGQLGVDRDEGNLNRSRVRELKRLVKATVYDGEF
jgi:hypothetical protein